jgi:hypothetical protein
MSILKKTLLAGFAVATLATAGTAVTTSQADAGYRSHGYNNHHNGYNNHHNGYKRHYRYNNYYYNCHYKKVWRTDYYGYSFLKTIKVCY